MGSLVMDRGPGGEGGRYVLTNLQDGGETWSVKQESNKPIIAESSAGLLCRLADSGGRAVEILSHRASAKRTMEFDGGVSGEIGPCRPPSPVENTLSKEASREAAGQKAGFSGRFHLPSIPLGPLIACLIDRSAEARMIVTAGLGVLVVFCLLLSVIGKTTGRGTITHGRVILTRGPDQDFSRGLVWLTSPQPHPSAVRLWLRSIY